MPFAVGAFSLEAVRVNLPAAAVPRLALSIMPCIEAEIALDAADAAVLSGEAGFNGETGRAIMLLAGEMGAMGSSLTGERGNVLELCDLGDSTFVGCFCDLDAGRAGPAGFVRLLFFVTGSDSGASSFSLSDAMLMSELFRFLLFAAGA